ncbi:MAG TPA: cation:proton antiporter regulatory subunit [Actinomycetota bacterium]|nr:cation:proton antiporter regulatory subunit [Actinomycetota bacterium]
MVDVDQLRLPGVGIRYEFTARSGQRIGVVAHRSGRREVFVADRHDPDSFNEVFELTDDESGTFAELLGGARVARELSSLQQSVEGLAIDWLPVDGDSPYVGRTIGDTQTRTRTGVSIVAVMRGDEAVPAPGPDFVLRADDVVVVVGQPRGIEGVVELLHAG